MILDPSDTNYFTNILPEFIKTKKRPKIGCSFGDTMRHPLIGCIFIILSLFDLFEGDMMTLMPKAYSMTSHTQTLYIPQESRNAKRLKEGWKPLQGNCKINQNYSTRSSVYMSLN